MQRSLQPKVFLPRKGARGLRRAYSMCQLSLVTRLGDEVFRDETSKKPPSESHWCLGPGSVFSRI